MKDDKSKNQQGNQDHHLNSKDLKMSLKRQKGIKALKGKVKWEGELEEMRRDL